MWYYSVGDRAQGPVDDSVILSLLASGQLTLVDLVYQEGGDSWMTINDVPQFKAALVKESLPPNPPTPPEISGGPFRFKDANDVTWVLLQKHHDSVIGADRYTQTGPYNYDQLEAMISDGSAHYVDYVWRPGYKRWARLGNLPEFDRRRKTRDNDPTPEIVPLPEIEVGSEASMELSDSSRAMLSNVLQALPKLTLPDVNANDLPEEASGPDLTENTASQFELPPELQEQLPESQLESPQEPSEPSIPNVITNSAVQSQPSIPSMIHKMQTPPPIGPQDDAPIGVYKASPIAIEDILRDESSIKIPDASAIKSPFPAASDDESERTVVQIASKMKAGGSAASPSYTSYDGDDDDLRTVVGVRVTEPHEPAQKKPLRSKKKPGPFQNQTAVGIAAVLAGLLVLGAIAKRTVILQSLGFDSSVTVDATVDVDKEDSDSDQQTNKNEVVKAELPQPQAGAVDTAQAPVESTPVAQAPAPQEAAPVAVTKPPTPKENESEGSDSVAKIEKPTKVELRDPLIGASGVKNLTPSRTKTSVVEIIPIRVDSLRPVIAINTDAPVGTTLWFSVSARSGDILKFPSYYKSASQMRGLNQTPYFDLTGWRLAAGTYRVEIVAGELHRAMNVFIGKKEATFSADLERHLKTISYQQQEEKKALYHSASELERLAKALGDSYFKLKGEPRSWRGFYFDWQKQVRKAKNSHLDRVALEKRNEFAFPDELIALKGAVERLTEQAETLNDSIMSGSPVREVAGGGTLSIVKEISSLKTKAAQISVRR